MYRTLKQVNWPEIEDEVLNHWEEDKTFQKSIDARSADRQFVFYEGPPSANGMPGIHHVMARAIKDIFCRYKTLQGYRVERKGGWDTHGLPIELQVEKRLGITKEDIGKKISVLDYNAECRKDVMEFKDKWDELTIKMGYWVDLDNPYVTYETSYIETLWYLLKQIHQKGFLYKGHTIQPYSPAAGTGLSSHELNQPGTYKNVKDTTAVAQFKLTDDSKAKAFELFNFDGSTIDTLYFLAWTTTPWTLPSNTALAVGKNINYVCLQTFNVYSHKRVSVIMAEPLIGKHFNIDGQDASFEDYKPGDKIIPYKILGSIKGSELAGLTYEQLLSFDANTRNLIEGDAFKVLVGDFVTTEDGTGIVHIAPSFGADDFRVAKQNGIGSLTLVDKRGKFLAGVNDGLFLYGEEYVKEDYLNETEKAIELEVQKEKLQGFIKDTSKLSYLNVDERIVLKLQNEDKLFKKEKYEHTYPHCWRTDKPILYYPLESWFVKTTAVKDKLVELNKTINWKPQSTGEGRFGNWLENLVDWNLSRSRYWGTPLPIWRTEEGDEEICIGSVEEFKSEIQKANIKLSLNQAISEIPDLHKPFVDEIILVSDSGKPMKRESDLIDVWFDSGAMPYAQWGLENRDKWAENFPADFIAEGVDQTRGWFFTLHTIAVMLFDSVAYKNVIANGLVLDKNGNKMSKRLGNAIDPFTTINKYGSDSTRWYMITNSDPWDNLKFDLEGIAETQRKFFGTLYNTYSFFAIYANIDQYEYNSTQTLQSNQLSELDNWILSKLNTLIKTVSECMDTYDPTPAARAIETFVCDDLSNWYIRLSRRRFWKGEMNLDKQSAYDTLYTCLVSVNKLMSPFAPFFSEWLHKSLKSETELSSIHLSLFPEINEKLIDVELEKTMQLAQDLSSMVLGLRKKHNIRVRQPLQKIMVPVVDEVFKKRLEHIQDLILSEVNVKELEYLGAENEVIVKGIKLNFKALGPKIGSNMKLLSAVVSKMNQEDIRSIEKDGKIELDLGSIKFELILEDVEISAQDIPGWLVNTNGALTVALDITISDVLKKEGIAREFVNRLQNLRKDSGFDVTDKILVRVETDEITWGAILDFKLYICSEILADDLIHVKGLQNGAEIDIEGVNCIIELEKNG
jgi:isoleucyl-tRNA synthetase